MILAAAFSAAACGSADTRGIGGDGIALCAGGCVGVERSARTTLAAAWLAKGGLDGAASLVQSSRTGVGARVCCSTRSRICA